MVWISRTRIPVVVGPIDLVACCTSLCRWGHVGDEGFQLYKKGWVDFDTSALCDVTVWCHSVMSQCGVVLASHVSLLPLHFRKVFCLFFLFLRSPCQTNLSILLCRRVVVSVRQAHSFVLCFWHDSFTIVLVLRYYCTGVFDEGGVGVEHGRGAILPSTCCPLCTSPNKRSLLFSRHANTHIWFILLYLCAS